MSRHLQIFALLGFGGFGVLTLSDRTNAATTDLGGAFPTWTHYSKPLTAAAFGNDPLFSSVILNVTKISIALDPNNKSTTDRAGLDNFTLSNDQADTVLSPEPATLMLCGVVLVFIGAFRRRANKVQ